MSSTEAPEIVMPDTSTDLLDLIAPYKESEDPDRRTHLVRPVENLHVTHGVEMSAQSIVDIARMNGQEVVALCGYRWVPMHNPESYEACGPCFKMAEWIMQGKFE